MRKKTLNVGPRSLQIVDPATGECHNLTRDDLARRPSDGIIGLSRHDHEQLDAIRHLVPPDLHLLADSAFPRDVIAAPPKIRVGQNIDRLREECGWSKNQLAKMIEMDKKNVLGHLSGRTLPSAETLLAYTSLFSDKLGRHVAVAELKA